MTSKNRYPGTRNTAELGLTQPLTAFSMKNHDEDVASVDTIVGEQLAALVDLMVKVLGCDFNDVQRSILYMAAGAFAMNKELGGEAEMNRITKLAFDEASLFQRTRAAEREAVTALRDAQIETLRKISPELGEAFAQMVSDNPGMTVTPSKVVNMETGEEISLEGLASQTKRN
jgi:hypothetical protein